MKIKTLIVSAIFTLASSLAFAGKYTEALVLIDTVEKTAMGSTTAARFSENENELIGCGTRTFAFGDGTAFNWGFCQASLAEEENVLCFTEDANLIEQINSVSDNAFITFRWDDNGECTYVGHSTQSFYIPGKEQLKDK